MTATAPTQTTDARKPLPRTPAWTDQVDEFRELVRQLPSGELDDFLDALPRDLQVALAADWRLSARPGQLETADTDKAVVLALAGRGYGKTWTGAHWVTEKVRYHGYRRVALVAETAADARDVMIEGESGILAQAPPDFRPEYEPSKRRLTWPNGATATVHAAESYASLRGPNNDLAWVDELAKYRYAAETWDELMLTMRLPGRVPLTLVTTTPRPTKLIRELLADDDVHVVRGSTYDNAANLSPAFLKRVEKRLEGTRLGRQELHAEVLDDVVGALWTHDMVQAARLAVPTVPTTDARGKPDERSYERRLVDALGLHRVVVAVDPAVSTNADSDETGIVVAGATRDLERAVVLDDLSGTYTPGDWAAKVKYLYDTWGADVVVAERNNGGDLVKSNLRTVDRRMNVETVWSYRGKALRAEPVSALYEQRAVKHLARHRAARPRPGDPEVLTRLESLMTEWVPGVGRSPDPLDAAVFALTALLLPERKPTTGKTALV